jgi:hypothetical protein
MTQTATRPDVRLCSDDATYCDLRMCLEFASVEWRFVDGCVLCTCRQHWDDIAKSRLDTPSELPTFAELEAENRKRTDA